MSDKATYQGIRYLDPGTAKIHLGNRGTLHVTIAGEAIYSGVWAVYLHPVSAPGRYISLHYHTGDGDKEAELGVIRRLEDFPEDQRRLVVESLNKSYFVHHIQEIHGIRLRYGFLEFDVTTDKGRQKFMMKWQMEKAPDYGERGKLLIDAFDNRFLIADVAALPEDQHALFTRHIYW